MELQRRRAVEAHLRFTLLLVAVAGAIALLGIVPTRRLGGDSAVLSMATALGLTVVTSTLAGLPVTLARIRSRKETVINVLLGSMVLRMTLTALLATALALSGGLDVKPFVLWVGIGYLLLLPIDTLYSLRYARSV